MTGTSTSFEGFSVFGPQATVECKTVSQWTEEWSKWWMLNPAENNPVNDDPTGQYACLNNDDKVFFIPGVNSGDVERSFDVPFGKPLLFPMLNVTYFREEGIPDDLGPVDDVLSSIVPLMKDMYATIDGQEIPDVERYLFTENDFKLTALPGSLAETFRSDPDPDARGPYESGTVGYWLMLDQLAKGGHTLEFGGHLDWTGDDVVDEGEQVNITANINVVSQEEYSCDLDVGPAAAPEALLV